MANAAWIGSKPIEKTTNKREYKIASVSAGDDIAVSLDLDKDIEILEVRVHLSAAEANTLTGVINSDTGAGYDYTAISEDMTAQTDIRYAPTVPLTVASDASFDLALTVAAGKTWNVSMMVKES